MVENNNVKLFYNEAAKELTLVIKGVATKENPLVAILENMAGKAIDLSLAVNKDSLDQENENNIPANTFTEPTIEKTPVNTSADTPNDNNTNKETDSVPANDNINVNINVNDNVNASKELITYIIPKAFTSLTALNEWSKRHFGFTFEATDKSRQVTATKEQEQIINKSEMAKLFIKA